MDTKETPKYLVQVWKDYFAPSIKGTPKHVVLATPLLVKVWIDAPTGDSSDSIVLDIKCNSAEEALNLVQVWEETWGINQ